MKLIQNTYINYFKKFINYGIENKKELSKYYFLSVIVALLELGGVALIYPFIFRLVNTSSMPGLKDFSLGFLIIIIFLLKNLFMIYYSKLQIDFVQKSEVYISQKFMKFFLFGSYSELYNISQAQKRQILSYIIPNCINNFLLRILNLSINFFIFALITLFLFTKFFIASVVTLICALLILYIEVKFINSKIKILPLKLKESDLKIGQFLNNIMLNVKNIKISGVEQVFFTDFSNLQEEKLEYNKKFQLYNLISPYITEPLIIILLFILLAVISLQNLDKSATLIASYALIASAIFRLAPTINRLQNNLVGIKNCLPIVTDFFKFYEKFNIDNIRTVSVDDNYKELQDSIELKDISYAYDKGEVLYNINLNIRKGEFIGIAGLSGVGKTTLVDIIAGLLPPKDGKFIIDGCSYKKIPNLRIGYIPQEYGIIPVSIRENVAFGQEKIDDDRVIEVLKIARIYDYIIENYTDGIYANPFVDSTGLSQGQKQRLAIARALYTNPDILILDEATSSLDLKTEDEICESLKALKGEKTILVIAHRLSTIKFADKIVFIENGTISDIAPFDDLIIKNKNFEEFVKLSFINKN